MLKRGVAGNRAQLKGASGTYRVQSIEGLFALLSEPSITIASFNGVPEL